MLITRADDVEVIVHQERDGLLGLLLFAQAVERRHGRSMSTDILDEFCSYVESDRSFYLSDDGVPDFITFQTGDGLYPRLKQYSETDRHGVVAPAPNRPITSRSLGATPRKPLGSSSSSPRVPIWGTSSNLTIRTSSSRLTLIMASSPSMALDLLEAVAFWVWECARHLNVTPTTPVTEIELHLRDPSAWSNVRDWSTRIGQQFEPRRPRPGFA